MGFWLFGALFSLLGGVLVSTLNYFISAGILRKSPKYYPYISPLRQILQIGYLVLLYFITPSTPWDLAVLLIGGAIGITGSMFFYTRLLIKYASNSKDDSQLSETEGRDLHG